MQYLFKHVLTNHKCNKSVIKHFVRTIIRENVIPLNEKSLTGRLLVYLNTNKDKVNQITRDNECTEILKEIKSRQFPNLGQYKTEDITSVLNKLPDEKSFQRKNELFNAIKVLDGELSNRLNKLEKQEIFNILHTYLNSISNRILNYRYYMLAVRELFKQNKTLTKSELIQLIFYIGLQKKSEQSRFMLRDCLKTLDETFINNLTTEELCIICNSTFKTSTKINNELLLDKVYTYLNDNLFLLKDPALFITLIKTLRHNRYQDEDILATISCTIFFNQTLKYYSFPAICHILALYSDFLYFDQDLLDLLTNQALKLLKESKYFSKDANFADQPRAKDINRFLWSLSNLNYKNLETTDIKNVIIPQVINRIESGEFKNDPTVLVEIILYLWILNYRAYELIPQALTKENVRFIQASKSPTKDRLGLLLSCIFYEDRDLYCNLRIHSKNTLDYDTKFQLRKRPVLEKVMQNLKKIAQKHEINKFEIGCQIPGLNIIGITGFQKNIYKAVHIEILDDYTCLKNTKAERVPTGPMSLKIRLLDCLDEGLILLNAEELDSVDEKELQEILEDEINLVV